MRAELTRRGERQVARDADAVAEVGEGGRDGRPVGPLRPLGRAEELEAAAKLTDGAAVTRQQVKCHVAQGEVDAGERAGGRLRRWVTKWCGDRRAPGLAAPAQGEPHDRLVVPYQGLSGSKPVNRGILGQQPPHGLHRLSEGGEGCLLYTSPSPRD